MKERFCCGQPIKSNKRVCPSVSAPLHLILRAPSPAAHEWKRVSAVKRLCQVCHLVVDGQGVKCESCGLRAHPQCGNHYPANLDINTYGRHANVTIRSGDSISSDGHRDFHLDRQGRRRQESFSYKHFEPRIKKILHAPLLSSIESGCEERHSGASSARFSSSCGDSVAASTAIVVGGTVSIETPRSESKTPEITITPGSEVATVADIEARLLSSSASVSELPDSGCTGLLDEEDDSHRADSTVPDNSDIKNISPGPSSGQRLLYVDGPLDGSPYAIINPLVKQKSLADSGISVDQMKDLDRLINALVQEAESIDIPYHARQDSRPFSYTSPQSITSQTEKRRQQSHLQSQQTSYSTVDNRQNNYSSSQVYSAVPIPDPYESKDTQQTPRGYQLSLEQQILNPQPVGALSRSISHQPSSTTFNNYEQRNQPVSSLLHESLSSNSFYGNGSTARRMRSQSADGRRDYERGDDSADEWLAKKMKKLQEKRESKNTLTFRNDWLAELKRALPTERSQSQVSHEQHSINEFRPTSTSRAETTPVSTGANISYSSDEDEDDVDMEVFHRGRKIQRHYSENAYDRGYTSSSSTRAPSQQSYTETPFPICPPTPYTNRPNSPGKPPRSPKAIRRYQGNSSAPIGSVDVVLSHMERAQTPVNPRPIFMVDSEVKFAQDLSEYWYKPFASREETVATLMQSPSGSFVIRNSNSFPGAYGLAIKVSDTSAEKGIRHFLIEPTRFGVRLRGCGTLEPVFSSLSALVYAHSIECLALPIPLMLPSYDILPSSQSQSTTAHLLRQGAACQLLFLGMVGVECLSGDEAIQRGIIEISASSPVPISLRLSKSGLTLTDVFRKQFFRIHFSLHEISYAAVVSGRSVAYGREVKQVFGIVARAPRATENSVILLAELEQGQPANAIVSFLNRVIAWNSQ